MTIPLVMVSAQDSVEADLGRDTRKDIVVYQDPVDRELLKSAQVAFNKATGELIFVRENSDAMRIAGFLTANQLGQGQRGQKGKKGRRGKDGKKGRIGREGKSGCPGPIGLQGDTGEPGDCGDDGPIGIQGSAGCPGPLGVRGDEGPEGEIGPDGPQGPAGPACTIGPIGPQGDKPYEYVYVSENKPKDDLVNLWGRIIDPTQIDDGTGVSRLTVNLDSMSARALPTAQDDLLYTASLVFKPRVVGGRGPFTFRFSGDYESQEGVRHRVVDSQLFLDFEKRAGSQSGSGGAASITLADAATYKTAITYPFKIGDIFRSKSKAYGVSTDLGEIQVTANPTRVKRTVSNVTTTMGTTSLDFDVTISTSGVSVRATRQYPYPDNTEAEMFDAHVVTTGSAVSTETTDIEVVPAGTYTREKLFNFKVGDVITGQVITWTGPQNFTINCTSLPFFYEFDYSPYGGARYRIAIRTTGIRVETLQGALVTSVQQAAVGNVRVTQRRIERPAMSEVVTGKITVVAYDEGLQSRPSDDDDADYSVSFVSDSRPGAGQCTTVTVVPTASIVREAAYPFKIGDQVDVTFYSGNFGNSQVCPDRQGFVVTTLPMERTFNGASCTNGSSYSTKMRITASGISCDQMLSNLIVSRCG